MLTVRLTELVLNTAALRVEHVTNMGVPNAILGITVVAATSMDAGIVAVASATSMDALIMEVVISTVALKMGLATNTAALKTLD